jgi:multimeric flavodoxin WrbA
MNIVCISAANISVASGHSASVQACRMIGEMFTAIQPEAGVEILPLIVYEMKPCRMCGDCLKTQRCAHDPAFNQVFEKMIAADALFVVVPHYAPFPSKVMILLEKLQEMGYLGYTNAEKHYHVPLEGKPVGLVGHGGQITTPETTEYYQKQLVDPLAMAFTNCGLRVIGAGEGFPNGVSYGIRSITKPEGSIFVDIQQDWDEVRGRLAPLVKNVAAAVGA